MRPVKAAVMTLFVALGLLTGSAHAFGPMMLLMLPMMTGGQHAMGNSYGAGEENRSHESHVEQSHPATAGKYPIASTGESESPQAGGETESDPAPRANTQ